MSPPGYSKGNFRLEEIWAYHEDTKAALRLYFSAANPKYLEIFQGESLSSLQIRLQQRLRESDDRSTMIVLSCIEAAFRIDYRNRVARKLKDTLSRSFRTLYQERGTRVRLDEDLFSRWRDLSSEHKQMIGELRSAFRFRHWIAHGRYWPQPGRSDFQYTYDLALATARIAGLGGLT